MSYKITIPFTPQPKGSVRLGRSGYYNPSCKGMDITKKYVIKQLKRQYPDAKLLCGPLLVIAHFMMPVPLSQSSGKRALRNFLPHIRKPDGDNLEKFLNDSLRGIIWEDDARIVWMLRSKTYTREKIGKTILFVRELENTAPNFDVILKEIENNINFQLDGENLNDFAE